MFYPHTEIHEKTLSGGQQAAKTTAPASQLWSYGWQAVEGQGGVDVDVDVDVDFQGWSLCQKYCDVLRPELSSRGNLSLRGNFTTWPWKNSRNSCALVKGHK